MVKIGFTAALLRRLARAGARFAARRSSKDGGRS
jgi:hypothetical protein